MVTAPRKLTGKTTPRLFTPPLRPLSRRTSDGYDLAAFADNIGMPLLPFQKWLASHMLELNPDGSPRFRVVLILMARQNGKTRFVQTVALWRLFADDARLVLGTAQDMSLARENLNAAIEAAQECPWLAADIAEIRKANGSEHLKVGDDEAIDPDDPENGEFRLTAGGRYKICAPNSKAGRGLSVDLLHLDEIREWRSTKPWSALSKTTSARARGLIIATTNAGDDGSVVLNQLREAGLSGRDPGIGVFEWSAVEGCDLLDWQQIRQANPGLGYTVSAASIRTASVTDRPEDYRTEVLCSPVPQLTGAVNYAAWQQCADPGGSLTTDPATRGRVAACFDISPDGQHCTLAAAARTANSRPRIEVVMAWQNTKQARDELPGLLSRLRPAAIAWYPSGPAGSFASILRPSKPLQRCEYTELAGTSAAEACMQLADLARSRQLTHAGQPVLDDQIRSATKTTSADGWRFARKDGHHVDGCYAAAGAVYAALALPEPGRARFRVINY